jgi:hypothetical protein
VALAIARLHFGGDLRSAIGLPEGSVAKDLDRLTDDFDATTNAILGEVFMEEIIHNIP